LIDDKAEHSARSFIVGDPYIDSRVIAADEDRRLSRKIQQAEPGLTGQ
jgi:hypothetical protein